MNPRSREETGRGESGFTLIEVILALSIFTVFAMAASITLLRGIEHRRTTFNEYRAKAAIRSHVARIQEMANRDHDSEAREGIAFIYERFHGKTTTVPELRSGRITVTCHADEVTVPAALGGPQDLNFDGDADGTDFLTFSNCYNGPANSPNAACENLSADFDKDGDVDGTDFLTFANCDNGSLNPPRCL